MNMSIFATAIRANLLPAQVAQESEHECWLADIRALTRGDAGCADLANMVSATARRIAQFSPHSEYYVAHWMRREIKDRLAYGEALAVVTETIEAVSTIEDLQTVSLQGYMVRNYFT